MNKALVVLSGGQDSTTCLALVKDMWVTNLNSGEPTPFFDEVHAITFAYGQRHARELAAAHDVAILAGCKSHELIDIGPGILKSTSPLVDQGATLEQYQDYKSMDAIIGNRIEKTFVPMRNALFLTIAANRAVELGCSNIYTGVCQADNANYPDCRRSFISSQESAINEALGLPMGQLSTILIQTPLMWLSKAASVRLLFSRGLESYSWLAFSHTAYDGQYPPVGSDHATILRAHGFEEAVLPDPLVLRAWDENLMFLPACKAYDDETLNKAILKEIAKHQLTLKAQA